MTPDHIDPVAASIATRAETMSRYEQARLGMFIHWNPWAPDDLWGMFRRNIPFADYDQRIRAFKPDRFDARKIVELARAAGMNYINFVAKHHDGFCLWDSAFTEFDSADYPVRRDFVRELADACHRADMPLFIYYSLGLDWTHPDFLTRDHYYASRPDTPEANASAKDWTPARFENYRAFCKNQLTELSRKYAPVAGFWFDPLGPELANPELFDVPDIYAAIRNENPAALILNKTGITGDEDVVVGERELASIAMHYPGQDVRSQRIRELSEEAWKRNRLKKAEIAVTYAGTWGYNPDRACEPADKLYAMLEKAADNNANLLISFGPMADGSIPPDVDREFRGLGKLICEKGYPPLNTTTWTQKRLGMGDALDTNEQHKTAR